MYPLKTNVPKFMQWKESLGQSISLDKREGWKVKPRCWNNLGKGSCRCTLHLAELNTEKVPGQKVCTTIGIRETLSKGPGSQKTKSGAKGRNSKQRRRMRMSSKS